MLTNNSAYISKGNTVKRHRATLLCRSTAASVHLSPCGSTRTRKSLSSHNPVEPLAKCPEQSKQHSWMIAWTASATVSHTASTLRDYHVRCYLRSVQQYYLQLTSLFSTVTRAVLSQVNSRLTCGWRLQSEEFLATRPRKYSGACLTSA
jgi:hypothetical protein